MLSALIALSLLEAASYVLYRSSIASRLGMQRGLRPLAKR